MGYARTSVIRTSLAGTLLAFSLQMALIGEGSSCQVDEDCSVEQYCYDVSQQCVDYTRCNRYNRFEGTGRSRHPSRCGKCLPSFKAEILSTGEEAILCKKMDALHTTAGKTGLTVPQDSAKLSNAVIIWIIIGAVFTIAVLILAFVFRKRLCAMGRKKQKSKQWTDVCLVGPTAPPPENGPFIETGERVTNEPFNNNHYPKDKSRLVNAIPCKEPYWVRTDPDYEHNLDNSSMNVTSHLHTGSLLPANNNSNAWEPVQLTIQGHTSEEMDNNINTDLYQINYPSSSGHSGNASGNDNDSSGGTSPEMNDGQQSRQQRGSNILITQKISMNVNVLNDN